MISRSKPIAFLLVVLLSSAGATTARSADKLSGSIKVDGSSTVYPLSKAVAEAFHTSNPDVQVDVKFSGTGGGFRKFCAGETDIEGASRPIKAEENEQCKAKHIDYVEVLVAFDSLAVVVNPKNTFASCLTVQELKKIWQPAAEGKISNWQQVRASFPSQPLTLFGPSKDDGTFDYFTFAIVGTETSSRSDYTANVDYAALARGVESDSNALGYFGNAYYQTDKDKLKIVAIDNGHGCVTPSADAVANDAYQPLGRPLLLYINAAVASRPDVKAFVRSFLAADNTPRVAQVGYVPLPTASLSVQNARLDKGVTGSAFGAHGSVQAKFHDWLFKGATIKEEDEDTVNAKLVQ